MGRTAPKDPLLDEESSYFNEGSDRRPRPGTGSRMARRARAMVERESQGGAARARSRGFGEPGHEQYLAPWARIGH